MAVSNKRPRGERSISLTWLSTGDLESKSKYPTNCFGFVNRMGPDLEISFPVKTEEIFLTLD